MKMTIIKRSIPFMAETVYESLLKFLEKNFGISHTLYFPLNTEAKPVHDVSNFASPCTIVLSLKGK